MGRRKVECPLPNRLRDLRERPELPEQGPGQSPGRNRISVLSIRHKMPLVEASQPEAFCDGHFVVRPPPNTPPDLLPFIANNKVYILAKYMNLLLTVG